MRFINVELPIYYKEVILNTVPNFPEVQKLDYDFMQDIIFIIAQGRSAMFRNLCHVGDLAQAVAYMYFQGHVTYMAEEEAKLYKLRMDLIDFADSPFLNALHFDPQLTLEEKFQFVCMILEEMLKDSAQRGTLDAMQQQGQQQGAQPTPQPSPQGQQSQAPQAGQEALGMTGDFFKGFSFLSNYLYDTVDTSYGAGGDGSNRGVSAFAEMMKEEMSTKKKIAELSDNIFADQYLEIFDIAKNLDLSFQSAKTGLFKDVDHIASNITVGKMRRMTDVTKSMPMEMAMEVTFDRKIMNKTLKVSKYRERHEQKQCLYGLLDCSGSMQSNYMNGLNRLQFVKAIAIALGKKALRDESVFYFRWFNSRVRDVFKLSKRSQWKSFLKHILEERPNGGTDVDYALHTGVQDILQEIDGMDKADAIVITDGTEDITEPEEFLEIKRTKGLKYHFLCLEDFDGEHDNIEKIADSFQIMDANSIENIQDYKPEFRRVI